MRFIVCILTVVFIATVAFAGSRIDDWLEDKFVVKHQETDGHTHDFSGDIYKPGKRDNTFAKKKQWYRDVHEMEHFIFEGGSDRPEETFRKTHTHDGFLHTHTFTADPDTTGVRTKTIPGPRRGSYKVVNWKGDNGEWKRQHAALVSASTHPAAPDTTPPPVEKDGNDDVIKYQQTINGVEYVVEKEPDKDKWYTYVLRDGNGDIVLDDDGEPTIRILMWYYTPIGADKGEKVDAADLAVWKSREGHTHSDKPK